ncbi:MAG: phosphotransferase [Elusimicrobia bacterium]|nr:phosphotransferase [Elusimicrobiota bacterium]
MTTAILNSNAGAGLDPAIGPDAASALISVLGRFPVKAWAVDGGNNRILKVRLDDGREVLVKRYLLDSRDTRDRAGAEFLALELMQKARMTCVPRALYKDPAGAFTIISLLEGRPMLGKAGRTQVLQAARFMAKLVRLRAPHIPDAADSRRCLADYPRHIERRLGRIEAGLSTPGLPAQACRFFHRKVLPLKDALLARFRARAERGSFDLDAPLPAGQRILSPSDFGFHNAVLSPKGLVQFLDFEYFGHDDPAKLAADFTWHLGQRISPELRALFVRELAGFLPDSESFLRRYELVLPLVGLEWVLIALNMLAPEQLARQHFSNPNADARETILRRLAVAAKLLRRLS